MSESDVSTWRAVLGIRSEVNQLMEKARGEKALGASLEAKVLVHVRDPAVRAALESLQASENGQDALRYAFIASQAELVASADVATAMAYSASAEVEGIEGAVTIGVGKADGHKCARCWNYSTEVGNDTEHPELCERCAPVVKAAGFPAQPPKLEAASATAR